MKSCVCCGRGLDDKSPCFELLHSSTQGSVSVAADSSSNKHFACPDCFGLLHAKRGCATSFGCPLDQCAGKVIGHRCWQQSVKTTRSGERHSSVVEPCDAVFIEEPTNMQADPCRWFVSKNSAFKEEHLMLSLQYMDKSDIEKLVVRSLTFPQRWWSTITHSLLGQSSFWFHQRKKFLTIMAHDT